MPKLAVNDVVVYGTAGTARDILETLEAANADRRRWNILGFLDDDPKMHFKEVLGYPVLGGAEALLEIETLRAAKIVLAMDDDKDQLIRKTVRTRLGLGAGRFPMVIHPSAVVSRHSQIAEGSVFLSGSFCANHTTVGRHVLVQQNTVIAHDSAIGDYVSFASNVATGGGFRIGEGSYVGQGASILSGVEIGSRSRVGMGAVVIRWVPDGATVVGSPARVIEIDERP